MFQVAGLFIRPSMFAETNEHQRAGKPSAGVTLEKFKHESNSSEAFYTAYQQTTPDKSKGTA